MNNTKYGLMTYQTRLRLYNVGDYIQSLAAEQYLPHTDTYIDRESLATYDGDPVRMIMNGWYMHNPAQWPPADRITPLFVSFHMNAQARDQMLSPEGVAYLKRQEPIGCRDISTLNALTEKSVRAWHSGCLTTTLDIRYRSEERSDAVYLVDPFFKLPDWNTLTLSRHFFKTGVLNGDILRMGKRKKLIEQVFTPSFLDNCTMLTHMHRSTQTDAERFRTATGLLHQYARARLVVTSRIHCALPCLALGTPVIFLNHGFSSDPNEACRVEGITDLFNTISIDDNGRMSSNFGFSGKIDDSLSIENPVQYQAIANILKEKCRAFTGTD